MLFVASLIGCGGGASGVKREALRLTEAGGEARFHDGALHVSAPAGFSQRPVTITSSKVPAQIMPLVPANLVHIDGTQFRMSQHTFDQPVRVSIAYLPLSLPDGVDPDSLRLCRAPLGGTWQETDSQIHDYERGVVSGETSRFSDLTVFGTKGSAGPPAFALCLDLGTYQMNAISLSSGDVSDVLGSSSVQPVYIARPFSAGTSTGWVGVGPAFGSVGGGTFFANYYENGILQQQQNLLAISPSERLVYASNDTDGTLIACTNTSTGTIVYRASGGNLVRFAVLNGVLCDSVKTVPGTNLLMATALDLSSQRYVVVQAKLSGGYTEVVGNLDMASGLVVNPANNGVTFAATNPGVGVTSLYSCAFDGTNQQLLLSTGFNVDQPRYLSDGSLIVRTSNGDGTYSLVRRPSGGSFAAVATGLAPFRIVGDSPN